jgi:hypothetical protein
MIAEPEILRSQLLIHQAPAASHDCEQSPHRALYRFIAAYKFRRLFELSRPTQVLLVWRTDPLLNM